MFKGDEYFWKALHLWSDIRLRNKHLFNEKTIIPPLITNVSPLSACKHPLWDAVLLQLQFNLKGN